MALVQRELEAVWVMWGASGFFGCAQNDSGEFAGLGIVYAVPGLALCDDVPLIPR